MMIQEQLLLEKPQPIVCFLLSVSAEEKLTDYVSLGYTPYYEGKAKWVTAF